MKLGTTTINNALGELAQERTEKRTTYPVRELPELQSIPTLTFLGTYSFFLPAYKTRYALDSVAIREYGAWQTPTELARDYLAVKYGSKPRQYHDQYIVNSIHRGFPYLAKPGHLEHGAYIDIKSAYWSILQLVGWDADYFPGRWLGQKSVLTDWPFPHNKLARNSLVSSSNLSGLRVWNKGKIEVRKTGNKLHNPQIISIVNDVLHGVAADMESLGAIYIHTDGYIVPGYLAGSALSLLERWGLPGTVKHEGFAVVRGVGAYAVGSHVSGTLGTVNSGFERNIQPRKRGWLADALRRRREDIPLFFGVGDDLNDLPESTWVGWGT